MLFYNKLQLKSDVQVDSTAKWADGPNVPHQVRLNCPGIEVLRFDNDDDQDYDYDEDDKDLLPRHPGADISNRYLRNLRNWKMAYLEIARAT